MPNIMSQVFVQGWVGLIQKYLIFISILSDLTLLKLVSYLILEIKGGLSFVSYLRYFFKLSSPTLPIGDQSPPDPKQLYSECDNDQDQEWIYTWRGPYLLLNLAFQLFNDNLLVSIQRWLAPEAVGHLGVMMAVFVGRVLGPFRVVHAFFHETNLKQK